MNKISLNASMRNNLLSLQNISKNVSLTQNRLSTGLKVNSAIDNPSSYYTARSLNNRAQDLSTLLDSMGQAIQTIKAATTALDAGAELLTQASAIAKQALTQAAKPTSPSTPPETPQPPAAGGPLPPKDIQEYIDQGYTVLTQQMIDDIIAANGAFYIDLTDSKIVLAEDIVLSAPMLIFETNWILDGNGHKISYTDSITEDGNTYSAGIAMMIGVTGGEAAVGSLSNLEIEYSAPHQGSFPSSLGLQENVAVLVSGEVNLSNIKITCQSDNTAALFAAQGGTIYLDSDANISVNENSSKFIEIASFSPDDPKLFDGIGNTQKIVTQLNGTNSAALATTQFYAPGVDAGHADFGQNQWYLGAIGEWAELYGTDTSQITQGYSGSDGAIGDKIAIINQSLAALGDKAGQLDTSYWSSSEVETFGSGVNAWAFSAYGGGRLENIKVANSFFLARNAVRAFNQVSNCFTPGSTAPKVGDIIYADKSYGAAADYDPDGDKIAVGVIWDVDESNGSVKIVNLKNLTHEHPNAELVPSDPYGSSMSLWGWGPDENITAVDDFRDWAGDIIIGGQPIAVMSLLEDTPLLAIDSSSQASFLEVISQYDKLIKDSSYKSINLLNGDALNVGFNEQGDAFLNIQGQLMTSASLGIATLNWQNSEDISRVIDELSSAMNQIRSFNTELGNGYGIITNRQEFTESLINVLTEGADKLTLADMNEESANMLALQTRQQLAVNALSLASQASQGILKLF